MSLKCVICRSSVMTSLPDHDALLDGIVKAQRDKKSSKSSRLPVASPRIDLKQQRYPVLPTITSNSNRCSDKGIRKESERTATIQQPHMPLPTIQPDPSHNIYPVPMATSANFMYGNVPVLSLLLPWQNPQDSSFNAHHNTTHNISNVRAKKKEPWFKKFNYRLLSEEKAAVIIQRHCRGYLIRRNLEFQQYLSNRWLSGRMVEKIVDEALQNDIIPDILMEVLQERMNCGGWFASDPEHLAQLRVCSQMINEVVSDLLPVCIKESNHELVIGYLHEHGVHREPLVHIVKVLVEETVDEMVREEVEGYISDTLQSYITESLATLLTNSLIEDAVDDGYLATMVVEAVTECSYDVVYDEAFQQELMVIVKECLIEEWAKGDWSAGSALVSPVFDEIMLRILLSHVADCGSVLDMQYYSDSIISEMMLRVSIYQMMNIHERQMATQDSGVLRQLHQRMFQEMAFDVLLDAWTNLWN